MKITIEFKDQESHRLRVCFGVSLFCDIPFTVISGHPGTHLTEVCLKQLSLSTLTIEGQLPAGTEVGRHGIGVFAHLQQQLSLQSVIHEELCLSISITCLLEISLQPQEESLIFPTEQRVQRTQEREKLPPEPRSVTELQI